MSLTQAKHALLPNTRVQWHVRRLEGWILLGSSHNVLLWEGYYSSHMI